MRKRIPLLLVALGILNAGTAAAQNTKQLVDLAQVSKVAIPLHIIEIGCALFICYITLKFFRITRPIGLFLYMYIALGFIIISSIMYLFLYTSLIIPFGLRFVDVYIASRISLIGMLASFVFLFYQWNRYLRKPKKK